MTERDFLMVLDSLDKRIQEGFIGVKEQIKIIEDNNKEKFNDLKICTAQHDKRIVSLEKAYAKIAGISATMSAGFYLLYQILFGS